MFGVRTEIIREMFSNPKWSKRLDKAKTVDEIAEIVAEFCRSKGYKIVKINVATTTSLRI